jgi:hypothetical protein
MDSLKSGDKVVIVTDYYGASAAELYPQNVVILKHLLKKENIKVVTVTFWAGGEMPQLGILEESGWTNVKKYGTDYIIIGLVPGDEPAMSTFARDTHKIVITDYYRTPIANLPLMNEIHSINDFAVVIFTTASFPDPYIRQFTGFNAKVIGCIQSYYYSSLNIYMNAGQIQGFVNGLRGSAEYELMSGERGIGLVTMDQTSVTHLYAIILLIIGNIGYLAEKVRKGGK